MNPAVIIRDETDADVRAISDVTVAAFESLPISQHTEQFIVEALRAANALTVSLVAQVDGRVAGHVAFSTRRRTLPAELPRFDGHVPQGTVTFHEAFKANGPAPGTAAADQYPDSVTGVGG